MKETLTVKRESLPVRCEVCHQTDMFNPETGVCTRCSEAFRKEPLPPWEAARHWNVPDSFRQIFLNSIQGERVWWVGRPVARLARRQAIGSLILPLLPLVLIALPVLLTLVSGEVWKALLGVVVFFLILFSLPFLLILLKVWLADRRLDHTLYVLTERRALILRDDRPRASTFYKLKKMPPWRIAEPKVGVGHLILAQKKILSNQAAMSVWDSPVQYSFLFSIREQGFFFVEDIREVERIVRENILGKGPER